MIGACKLMAVELGWRDMTKCRFVFGNRGAETIERRRQNLDAFEFCVHVTDRAAQILFQSFHCRLHRLWPNRPGLKPFFGDGSWVVSGL